MVLEGVVRGSEQGQSIAGETGPPNLGHSWFPALRPVSFRTKALGRLTPMALGSWTNSRSSVRKALAWVTV